MICRILACTVLISILLSANGVFAIELFYPPVRWQPRNGSYLHLKVNKAGLYSHLQPLASMAVSNWHGSNAPVWAEETTWGYSNIDYSNPSDATWLKYAERYATSAIGVTLPVDTANNILEGDFNTNNSTRQIKYAYIYIRTTNYGYVSPNNDAKEVFAHEIGHALGMGHRELSENSLMRIAAYGTLFAPTAIDVADLNNMY